MLTFIVGCNETTTTHYASFQEAQQDNLFTRGWLPDVLPTNSENIIETHNTDTNQRCSQAVIPIDSLQKIESSLLEIGFSKNDTTLPPLPKFPLGTKGCTFSHQNISNNYVSYINSEQIAVLDKHHGKFFFWSH